MAKPTYQELAYFIERLNAIECDEDCPSCVLFYSGFCKEAGELMERMYGEDDDE